MTTEPQLPAVIDAQTLALYNGHTDNDFEDMRASDKIIPRLILLQYGSQPVKDGKFRAGTFINSASEEAVLRPSEDGKATTIGIVPLMWWKEWIEWNPDRNADKKILDRSTDPNSALAKRSMAREQVQTKNGPKFAISEAYTFLILCPEFTQSWNEPMLFSFARSAWNTGKKFLNRAQLLKNNGRPVPLAGAMWELSFQKESKDGDDWVVPVIGAASFLDPDALALTLPLSSEFKAQREAFMNNSLKDVETTHKDGEKEEEAPF